MFAVQPVKIYPGVPICQIFFHEIVGAITEYSSDKYQHNRDIQPSQLFRELGTATDGGQQLHLEFANDRHGAAAPLSGRSVRSAAATGGVR
jgi:dCTP deaminase